MILSSGSSSVMLNGVPGRPFKCKRGVRQGDPLSPLLFVVAADLLQSIVNKAANDNVLAHPLGNSFGGDFPIIQYADDTLVILPAEEQQLINLKEIHDTFAISTGLRVNFMKSFIVPINVDPQKTSSLANAFGCQLGQMSFTYLSLPLGTTRPTVEEYLPLVSKVERRMMGLYKLLRYSGRLLLVNSVLSSLPTYYLCTLKIPLGTIDQVDKYRKHLLWDRGDVNRKGGCLVACRPKEEGGLGIIDLRTRNIALLLKHLDKFYKHADIPWVAVTWKCLYSSDVVPHMKRPVDSFWWKDVMSLSPHFMKIASCSVQAGNTVSFWSDSWDLGILDLQFPQLASFASNRKISVKMFVIQDVYSNFQTPISPEASDQLAQKNILLQNFMPEATQEDQWTYIWGNPIFKSKRAYKALRGAAPSSPVFKWMWQSCCRGRHKFFFWLLLRDRLNTRNILRRKRKILDDYNCPLCAANTEETFFHLFFQCSFSQWCSRLLHVRWNLGLSAIEM